MPKITITHQEEKTKHSFTVKDPDRLTQAEVNTICQAMFVEALLINGKYYKLQGPLDFDLYLKHSKSRRK